MRESGQFRSSTMLLFDRQSAIQQASVHSLYAAPYERTKKYRSTSAPKMMR